MSELTPIYEIMGDSLKRTADKFFNDRGIKWKTKKV